MLDYLPQIIDTIFNPATLFYMLLGVSIGIIGGCLPGINAAICVALTLPLTYGMPASRALIMLAAIYTGAMYGGGTTAALCAVPGTPAAAATVVDGYPLTQKGKGREACGIVTLASACGGMIGALILLFLAPPIGRFSLNFVCAEYFLISIFALLLIAPLSGDSMAKGIFTAALGLFLGTIGFDAVDLSNRFTFGLLSLEEGLETIPVLVGAFSISQCLILAYNARNGKNGILDDPSKALTGKMLPPFSEIKKLIWPIIRSGLIGTGVGIIPAAGNSIAAWIAYTVGKGSSKHPEEFGQGCYEGVACPESANNACAGGALIPMFTLGVPGSGVTAILLGGMLIHGLQPGASLFSGAQAATAYSMFVGYLISNMFILGIGLVFCKYLAKVSTVPNDTLCPVIICLAMIGTYSIRSNLFDIIVLLVFGVIGILFKKYGFPIPPLVLGFVLSDICELNFRRCLVLKRDMTLFQYFCSRPICLVLMILIVISLFFPLISNFVSKYYQQKKADALKQ